MPLHCVCHALPWPMQSAQGSGPASSHVGIGQHLAISRGHVERPALRQREAHQKRGMRGRRGERTRLGLNCVVRCRWPIRPQDPLLHPMPLGGKCSAAANRRVVAWCAHLDAIHRVGSQARGVVARFGGLGLGVDAAIALRPTIWSAREDISADLVALKKTAVRAGPGCATHPYLGKTCSPADQHGGLIPEHEVDLLGGHASGSRKERAIHGPGGRPAWGRVWGADTHATQAGRNVQPWKPAQCIRWPHVGESSDQIAKEQGWDAHRSKAKSGTILPLPVNLKP